MKLLIPLVLLAIVSLTASYEQKSSHYTTKYYPVSVVRYRHRCSSGGWWFWYHIWCWPEAYSGYRLQPYQACADGYRGTQCNIPICSPRCANRGVCVAVNRCECSTGYTGGRCEARKCNWDKDCYPGFCKSGSVTCDCSSEFEGNNCENMKEGPTFQLCRASLIDERPGRNDVFNVNCSFYGDNITVYTNKRDFTHVSLDWSATYRKLEDLPPYPTGGYMKTFRVGLITAGGEVELKDTVGMTVANLPASCLSAGSWKNPQETIRCQKKLPFNQGVKHRQQLIFKMSGTTGGFKDIRNQDTAGSYKPIKMLGRQGYLTASVKFDLEPPFHCTEGHNGYPCDQQDYMPMILKQAITTTPKVTIAFVGWNDTDSGLRGFIYSVYRLRINGEGLLQNESNPVLSKAYDLFSGDFKSTFQLPSPGMYAVVGAISDFANNTRYTRGLLLYGNSNASIETSDIPISVLPEPGTRVVDGAFWISKLSDPVSLKWGKHFVNRFFSANRYGNPVAPLSVDFLESRGNLSANGTPNIGGITKFAISVIHRLEVPKLRQRRELRTPASWTPIHPLTDTVTLTELNSRRDGNSYTIFMKAEDVMGNIRIDHIYIRVDSTPPVVKQIPTNFVKNVKRDVDGFYSSVDVSANDFEGGLHSIGFTLYDMLNPDDLRQIKAAIQLINRTDQDPNTCQAEGKCSCTKETECYQHPLKLYIDNCWLVSYMRVPIKMDISINNRAGLSTNITYQLGKVEHVSGVGEYPKPTGLRVKDAYGYVVVLTWYLPVSCYDIRLLNLQLTGASNNGATLSANEEEIEIKDLVPYADYKAKLSILYEGNRESDFIELQFNTGKPPTDQGSKCGTGCIIGIVIGVLILIGIAIIIVFVVIRLRRHQTPLPQPMMGRLNRISRHFGHDGWEKETVQEAVPPPSYRETVRSNAACDDTEASMVLDVAKLGDFEEDIYTYGEMKTDLKAKWKHSNDRVTVGKTIYKGRFAEIKAGQLREDSGTRKVAVKMLLDRSSSNVLLMKAKMNFLATVVPKHNNIVNFSGAVPEGPIILLEFCEPSLKDWLKSNDKVTDEVEDNMINFSTDVARGMSHLHQNGIIHRRLGARNVLLKQIPEMFRLVAKVTGFGPMAAESSSGDIQSDKERIPIKWMALEQLGIERGNKRPYTKATDVWSYGVTIWEIFSQGMTPFAKVRSTEIRSLLEEGTRLEQPEHASDELYKHILLRCWASNPEQRPNFQELNNDLISLFHGAGGGDFYYDDAPKGHENIVLYEDTGRA